MPDDELLDFSHQQTESHKDEVSKSLDDKTKSHETYEVEDRCIMCGDSLWIYNPDLIKGKQCPKCQAEDLQKEKEKKMNKEMAIITEPIVMPAVTKEKAIEAFNAYQDLAKEIIRPEDIQKIAGKDFKRKSFWRKCQRFFNLSLEKVEERREIYGESFTYHFIFRATAPNGAFVDGTGSCSSDEKGMIKTEHNTRATAETRAKNRAIADLVAFGEVSAEEVVVETHQEPTATTPAEVTKVVKAVKGTIVKHDEGPEILVCSNVKCSTVVSEKTANFSKSKYGKIICWNCQKQMK